MTVENPAFYAFMRASDQVLAICDCRRIEAAETMVRDRAEAINQAFRDRGMIPLATEGDVLRPCCASLTQEHDASKQFCLTEQRSLD